MGKLAQTVKFLSSIRHVNASKLGQNTENKSLSWSSSARQCKYRDNMRPEQIPSTII
jgi:hypothetical protein